MSVVKTQYENMKKLDIESLLQSVIQQNEAAITQINREQMLAGKRGDGPITPLTSEGDNPDLFDTGAFQSAMFTDVQGNNVITSSSDSKTSLLVDKYKKSIFELDKDYKEDAQDLITPQFNKLFHELINK